MQGALIHDLKDPPTSMLNQTLQKQTVPCEQRVYICPKRIFGLIPQHFLILLSSLIFNVFMFQAEPYLASLKLEAGLDNMSIKNLFVNYLLERMASEVTRLAHYNKRTTREICCHAPAFSFFHHPGKLNFDQHVLMSFSTMI